MLPDWTSVGVGTYFADLSCHRWGSERISIGKYCSISQGVKLLAGGGHRRDTVSTYPFDVLMRGAKTASPEDRCYEHGDGIQIGSDVHLGFGVTVIGSVKIGDGAVIAANATVFTDVPPYGIAVGNPARVTKFRFDEPTVEALQRIKWWNWGAERIAQRVDDFYSPIAAFIRKYDPALGWSEHAEGCVCSGCRGGDGKQYPVLVTHFTLDKHPLAVNA